MTITVTKRGTPPEQILHAAMCPRCKTEFTFHSTDAQFLFDQRDGDTMKIPCPVCNNTLWVIPSRYNRDRDALNDRG